MIEKVNPKHPDKIADRIAGAIVDIVYNQDVKNTIAVEVLIGHKLCTIIVETNSNITEDQIEEVVHRISTDEVDTKIIIEAQDRHLQSNQRKKIRCGDNGIFKGVPLTEEEKVLSGIAREIYKNHPYDGKYILDKGKLTICQSNTQEETLRDNYPEAIINPLGYWTGGTTVDTGCTNRKLGSDQAQSITGGGLHGKDLSKADVSVNIYAFLKAQETGEVVELSTSIGDSEVDGKPYEEIVSIAEDYINMLGGFEKFAEWGLF